MICNSPSRIYDHALLFSPSSSWFHKYYTAELLQVPKLVKGSGSEWGKCSRTVSIHRYKPTLSYWGNVIAVGCEGRNIIILDVITGSQTAVLSGHSDRVRSVTFSSDGRLLVSGSYDRTVKLWDMQTGGAIKTFCGHTSRVTSVSISADHTRIASGSWDRTICLWDIQTGECLCTINSQPL
jgi:WD40 repeat protein